MLKRILVPLDGSSRAEQVLPVAARLAQASGGTILLLNVVNIAHEALSYGIGTAFLPSDTIENALIGGRTYLGRLIQHTHLTGMAAVEKQAVIGNPAEKILLFAQEQQVDLIVMASHGYTGFKQWLMGSVAENVAQHAPVPVLILRDGAILHTHLHSDGPTAVRALIPLDLPAHSQDAILPVAELVAALSSPGLGALHLIQLVVPPEDASEAEQETFLQEAMAHLDTVGQQIRGDLRVHLGPDLLPKVTWSISMDSDIAEGIARVAENGEETAASGKVKRCDLIAMTTHSLGGNQKWVTGSVTDRVLHATRLPLLMVRPREVIEKERRQKTDHVRIRA
jgi:nucleotide-binding universal stress UspA family protein